MVRYFIEDICFSYKKRRNSTGWIKSVIFEESKSRNNSVGEINIIFCSDPYLLDINKKYLKHEYYTDIITFDNCEDGVISGDLFISIDTVKNNAREYSETLENELHRVIIHGILHLLGYNDNTNTQGAKMREMENIYLNMRETG